MNDSEQNAGTPEKASPLHDVDVRPDEVPPYERAKGLAVGCWRAREKWCEHAYDFWLGQYAATGEPEAQAIVNRMRDLWNTARVRREALEGAGAVGGTWLAQATIERRKAQSHIVAISGGTGTALPKHPGFYARLQPSSTKHQWAAASTPGEPLD